MVSGLHCTMPNGTSAPGNVLPPLLVQVRVSTSVAGAPTVDSVALFLAPAGSWGWLSAGGHEATLPSTPFLQLTGGDFAPASLTTPSAEPGGGLAVGLGPAVAARAAAPPTEGITATRIAALARITQPVLRVMRACCLVRMWSPPNSAHGNQRMKRYVAFRWA